MHFRRFATLLLGAWLAGGLFMAMVATQNFRSVDRMLMNPEPVAAQEIAKLGHEPARALLRYQVSEQNRWYFEVWGLTESGLGLVLLLVLLFGSLETVFSLVLALAMLLLALLQRLFLTPEIIALGRALDFQPAGAATVEGRFWVLHGAYTGIELVKWLMGFVLAGKLIIGSRNRLGGSRDKINLIDKTDYGHIDG